MRGERSGGQGQPGQTKRYYRIVYFYGFKCFRLVLKNKGNAGLFFQILNRGRICGGTGRAARASLAIRKYITGLFIFTGSNNFC